MHASDGVSPKSPASKAFEEAQKIDIASLNTKIHVLQEKINALCSAKLQKLEILPEESAAIKKNLYECISLEYGKSLNSILNRQIDLINNIFTSKDKPDSEKLFNDLKNTTLEVEELLTIQSKQPVNPKGIENLSEQSTAVTKEIRQVNVLSQTQDQTGSGGENCGYHSLKNALCLMSALLSENEYGNEDEKSFNDPKHFEEFYSHYASPLLTEKEKGKKDASDPILRQMISTFVSDPTPPTRLQPLQKVLKNNLEKLGVYTLLSANNEAGLKLTFMDEAGFMDALKIFKFSQDKGPSVLICPVGNVNTMHWYSIAMIKNEDGAVNFFGCDSLEGHQRGNASPLGKVCNVFNQTLINPNEFIESALSSFVEGFERYGDWLESNDTPDTKESKASLMELAKDPLNLPGICHLALENMLKQNWQDSSDIQKLLQFDKVLKLANFFSKELPADSIEAQALHEILDKLNNKFDLDAAVQSLMKKTLAKFDTLLGQESQLPLKDHIAKTKSIFSMMLFLYQKRDEITSEKSQTERENRAQNLSQAGVEKGFITGKSAAEAKKNMEYRTHLLLITLQKAEQMGKIYEFYQKVADGDPCLNARMGRVEEYLSELSGHGDFLQDLSTDRIFAPCDVALMGLIDKMVEDNKLDEDKISELKPEDIDEADFAAQFGKLDLKSTNFIPFLDYLVRVKFCENKDNIDWTDISKKLIQSEEFKTLLRRGINLALLSY